MSGTTHGSPHGGHGRHRRDHDTAMWTPVTMPTQDRPGRHARPEPLGPPGRGTSLNGTLPESSVSPTPSRGPLTEPQPQGPPPDDEPTQPQALQPLPPDPLSPEHGAGLGKFDLGTVPASVTPPTSWRRAALFTVFASAGVLVTLVFVSTSLMEPQRDAGHIDALPGVGKALPYTSGADPATNAHGAKAPEAGTSGLTSGASGSPSDPAGISDGGIAVITGTGDDASSGRRSGRASGTAGPTVSSVTTSYPAPTTVVVTGPPRLAQNSYPSPEKMNSATGDYFQAAATDPQQASAMTGGSLREEGASGIRQRYPDARSIQVRRIKSDPSRGTTTNAVTIHKTDGSTTNETRTLEFGQGDNPEIVADHS